jgi:S1-C subfamily serine protease
MERERRSSLQSYVLTFVLGFTACAGVTRFLLPLPVGAAAPESFAGPNPAEVAAEVGDSVVTVETYPATSRLSGWQSLLGGLTAQPEPLSVASGVVYSRDGYVVTNAHVVEGAGRVHVRLANDHEFDAKLIGADKHADLAVLKIKERGLQAAEIGDSQRVRAGESVVAIGNPLGFEHSVSVGVVSANRTGPLRVDGTVLGDMIQTDAAINQGNSGGGLFTADGRLIGINTAIMVPRGGSGSIGIGFAIPSHRVRPVVNALIALGRVPRPWLGIRYHPPSEGTLVRHVRYGTGVLVEDVLPGSPAALAGLLPSDVIRRIGECAIHSPDDIYSVVERYRPGTKLTARVLRGERETSIALTLGEKPD